MHSLGQTQDYKLMQKEINNKIINNTGQTAEEQQFQPSLMHASPKGNAQQKNKVCISQHRLFLNPNSQFNRAIQLGHSDFSGLLIGEIDERKSYQKDRPYIRRLMDSEILKKRVREMKKQGSNSEPSNFFQSRPKTAASQLSLFNNVKYKKQHQKIVYKDFDDFQKESKINQKIETIDEIDSFDKRFFTKNKKMGYPSVNLEETIMLSASSIFGKFAKKDDILQRPL